MQKVNILPLTSLRFFAALLVIFFHNPGIFYQLFVERLGFYSGFLLAHHGYATVAFFFVLSGFILAYNYSNRSFQSRSDYIKFFAARIARIYPAYIGAIFLALPFLIIRIIQQDYSFYEWKQAFLLFPATLVMLHAWIPFWLDNFANINGPGWSLSVELFLYVMFPFLLLIFMRLKSLVLLFLLPLLCFAGMAGIIYFEYTHFGKAILMSSVQSLEVPGGGISWQMLVNTIPPIHLPQFAVGIIGGVLFVRLRFLITNYSWLVWFVAIFIAWVFATDHFSSRALQTGFMAVPYMLLLLLAASDRGMFSRLLSHPLLVRLGDISYCIYIFAFPIEYYFQLAAEEIFHVSMNFLLFPVYLLTLILFCNWFHGYEERWRIKIKKIVESKLLVTY